MASHKLKINYDDTTGTVTMSHRCTVDVAGHAVGHELPIDPPPSMAGGPDAAGLTWPERLTLTLLAREHLTAAECAAALGVTHQAVYHRLGRVREKLTRPPE